jgi:hypothetical protein
MKTYINIFFITLLIAVCITGCPSPGGGGLKLNLWTWMSGSDVVDQTGSYGDIGVTDPANMPGARGDSAGWIDADGNLWLFGGGDYIGGEGKRNDLWVFDGSNWTWVSGSSAKNQSGTYGALNTPAGTNIPGARSQSISWIDTDDNFWLFGGGGYDSAGAYGELNDLWRFDGVNWTWKDGSNLRDQGGDYGTLGVASPSDIPGARSGSVGWIDSFGNLWLFGGYGWDDNDGGASEGNLNDLWRADSIDTATPWWTWIKGSNSVDQAGVYGTQGQGVAANKPGARDNSTGWIDADDNLWLFGGRKGASWYNDLWKFDGTNWIWVSGSNASNQSGVYGTKGEADPANVPGARYGALGWIDSAGNLWLFGGSGFDNAGDTDELNDLWKFDGENWTWMSGSDVLYESGTYGTMGKGDEANVPGARCWSMAWTESGRMLWLFGGEGYDSTGAVGLLNDLWKIQVR